MKIKCSIPQIVHQYLYVVAFSGDNNMLYIDTIFCPIKLPYMYSQCWNYSHVILRSSLEFTCINLLLVTSMSRYRWNFLSHQNCATPVSISEPPCISDSHGKILTRFSATSYLCACITLPMMKLMLDCTSIQALISSCQSSSWISVPSSLIHMHNCFFKDEIHLRTFSGTSSLKCPN